MWTSLLKVRCISAATSATPTTPPPTIIGRRGRTKYLAVADHLVQRGEGLAAPVLTREGRLPRHVRRAVKYHTAAWLAVPARPPALLVVVLHALAEGEVHNEANLSRGSCGKGPFGWAPLTFYKSRWRPHQRRGNVHTDRPTAAATGAVLRPRCCSLTSPRRGVQRRGESQFTASRARGDLYSMQPGDPRDKV